MDYIIEDYTENTVSDLPTDYASPEINNLTYKVIGAAMEVHNAMGKGFSEVVYKDCLSLELGIRSISFEREKKFDITYKGIPIPHNYFADFIIEGKVVLEIKAHSMIHEEHTKQILNYLAASKCKIGLLINFGENSLKYKRIILTK